MSTAGETNYDRVNEYSAVKIAGERAYDLARAGEEVKIEARPVDIGRLAMTGVADADHTEFEAECGTGTYVRALARDLGRALGTYGHVVALRRTSVGPFVEAAAAALTDLPAAEGAPSPADRSVLLPVSAGLAGLPALAVSRADASRLARGQAGLRARTKSTKRASAGDMAPAGQTRLVSQTGSTGRLRPRASWAASR